MGQSEPQPAMRIGHVHLRVANLERAAAFYRDVLGFTVTAYGPDFGLQASLLAGGDYHHHVGLNTWLSEGGTPPPAGHTGLHHFAILYPGRMELARAVQRVREHGYPLDEAEDHGVSVSVYLREAMGSNCTTIGLGISGSTPKVSPSSKPNRSTRRTF